MSDSVDASSAEQDGVSAAGDGGVVAGLRRHPTVRAVMTVTLAFSCVVVAGFGTVSGMVAFGFRWNFTPSMPKGLYRIVDGPIATGAIVTGCLPERVVVSVRQRGYLPPGNCRDGVMPVVKRVVALPGDRYVVDARGVWVNGRGLGRRPLVRDASGRSMARAGSGIVPSGEALLLGDSEDSWDGRYYGPIPLAGFQRVIGIGGV